jgi:hypothetical protein
MRILAAKASLVLIALTIPATATAETYVFGGPGSAEGRFEDAQGNYDTQGWIYIWCTPDDEFWQVSTFMAENLNGHGGGNHALWAGQTAEQQPDWVNPPGYGNDWRAAAEWTAQVPDPSSAVEVGVEFHYNLDGEDTYEFLMLEWYDGTHWNGAFSDTGTSKVDDVFPVPGELASPTWTIQPSQFTGIAQDEVRLRLFARSDGGVSDQDGLLGFDFDGLAQVDDVVVTFDGTPVDGGGDDDGVATFESGDDEGWTPMGSGCVCSVLSSLPAQYEGATANPTPVMARMRDASVPVAGRCVFTSPLFGWTIPEPVDGAYLEFDSYFWSTGREGFTNYRVDMTWKVGEIWQPVETVFVGDMPSPGWQNIQIDLTGIAPVEADSCAIGIDTGFGDGLTDIVALDNITLARYDTAVAAPPPAVQSRLRVSPNPANPLSMVEFELDRPAPVQLVVYDVRGRVVRRLAGRNFDAGLHKVPFDGLTDRGGTLASGVYFVRLETPSRMLTTRVTIVK